MTKKVRRSALSWRSRVKDTVNVFLNTLLPPVCAGCNNKVGSLLCRQCRERVQRLDAPICPSCGELLPRMSSCHCAKNNSPLKEVRAATQFTEPISTLIHKFKYADQFALAEPLAQIMAEQGKRWSGQLVNLVVPIPLHPDREKARGYNQSALLARHYCRLTALPYDSDVIQRVRYTNPQVGLSAGERKENVANAFWAQPGVVAGKKILLIDDVYTTGATMSAAATALLAGRATAVSAYCLARAV